MRDTIVTVDKFGFAPGLNTTAKVNIDLGFEIVLKALRLLREKGLSDELRQKEHVAEYTAIKALILRAQEIIGFGSEVVVFSEELTGVRLSFDSCTHLKTAVTPAFRWENDFTCRPPSRWYGIIFEVKLDD